MRILKQKSNLNIDSNIKANSTGAKRVNREEAELSAAKFFATFTTLNKESDH